MLPELPIEMSKNTFIIEFQPKAQGFNFAKNECKGSALEKSNEKICNMTKDTLHLRLKPDSLKRVLPKKEDPYGSPILPPMCEV